MFDPHVPAEDIPHTRLLTDLDLLDVMSIDELSDGPIFRFNVIVFAHFILWKCPENTISL